MGSEQNHQEQNEPVTGVLDPVLPGLGVFGERCQAAGVHVPSDVYVDRGVGLGELGG